MTATDLSDVTIPNVYRKPEVVKTIMSSDDAAVASQTYRRAAPVASGPGHAVFVTGVTTAGTVNGGDRGSG